VAGVAEWIRPIEEALAGDPLPGAEHWADIADAEEDRLQALYRANPCTETARITSGAGAGAGGLA
jgi:hypothetical protein